MKLTKIALDEIKSNKRARARLALALDKSDFTIQRYLASNSDELTKAAALEVIRQETGLDDSEILEKETVQQ
jgi:hypothetical protein